MERNKRLAGVINTFW